MLHAEGAAQDVTSLIGLVVRVVVTPVVKVAATETVCVIVCMIVATTEDVVTVDVKDSVVVDVLDTLETWTKVVSAVAVCVDRNVMIVFTVDVTVRKFDCVCGFVMRLVACAEAVWRRVVVVNTVATWVRSCVAVLEAVASTVDVLVWVVVSVVNAVVAWK